MRFSYPKTLIAVIAFVLFSCSNDDSNNTEEFVPIVPTAAEFNQIRQNALENRTQSESFDVAAGLNFTSDAGCNLTIAPNCLLLDGTPVTGMVDLEYVEIFNAGDMLVTNKTTMGRLDNGDLSLLESGGAFYINVTQNGQQLQLGACVLNIEVPANLTGGPENDMTLWTGVIDDNQNLAWDENENEFDNAGVFLDEGSYFCVFGNFGWTNVDRFVNDPRPKTTILVDVPNGYDNTNASVYLLYQDQPNALAHLDTYDEETGYFSEHYGQVPIGLQCHVIFVSEIDGQFAYAIKAETIEENEVITFTLDDLMTASEDDLANIISNL